MKLRSDSKLICIKVGASMSEAKNLMTERRVRHLPVIDDSNQVLGMLSKHDLTDVPKFQQLPVELFLQTPVEYVIPETPLSEIALKMIQQKISSVLVCDDSKMVYGIITTDDLLYEFSKVMKEKETDSVSHWSSVDALNAATEVSRKLADIGI